VLSVVCFWPLCCLSFSFDHCVVCLFLLTIVLSVFDIRILITPLVSSNSSSYEMHATNLLICAYWKNIKCNEICNQYLNINTLFFIFLEI
jgi:hypothetical protein